MSDPDPAPSRPDPLRPTFAEYHALSTAPIGTDDGLRAAYALALPRMAALLVGACQRYEYDLPHEDGMHAVLCKAADGPYIRADHLLAAAARLTGDR